MGPFSSLRLILLVTVLIYFIYEQFDGKHLKDEREELIRLKTYGLVHTVTTTTLCLFAIIYLFFPRIDALYPLMAVVLSYLYTEIIGKIYFRKKY